MAAGLALAGVALAAAPTVAHAAPFVAIDGLRIDRDRGRAVVTARITWHGPSVGAPYRMRVGDLRLVAVSDQGHRPTLLGADTADLSDGGTARDVRLTVTGGRRLAAMRRGNRVVLSASQHAPVLSSGRLTDRTYVTVGQAQPYRSRQPHVGTEDCSGTPVEVGAQLEYCDLVGAFLDGAIVSVHDPGAFECQIDSRSTCLRRADLTGATMVGADLSGANLGGARVNGADGTRARLDDVSLAGAEAVGVILRRATSDREGIDSAADFFDARLTEADLRETEFNGVSLGHARLNGARAQGAVWNAVNADAASFAGANLAGLRAGAAPSLHFADFTRATLVDADDGAASVNDLQLRWATLCDTVLPRGLASGGDRDCRTAVEAPATPLPGVARTEPFVAIADAQLDPPGPGPRRIAAAIRWDAAGGLTAGDIRVVAIDRASGLPTVIDAVAIAEDLPEQTPYALTVTDPAALAAMGAGNRVVLTATQHPEVATPASLTRLSYVTVATLQRGPGRGRVGMYDCSRVAIAESSAQSYDFCDFAGAALANASVRGAFARKAELTGATLTRGALQRVVLDGAALAGVEARRATWSDAVSLFAADAPRLSLGDGVVDGAVLRAARLDEADFTGAQFVGETTTFATAPLRRASFAGAELSHTDLAFADLAGARFDGARATAATLFLSELAGASLTGSTWTADEVGEPPWTWSTLCGTAMPADAAVSGDRDCPR